MWDHPYIDCVLNVFGVRAGCDVDTSHKFPQCVLVTITMIEAVVGVRGAKTCSKYEAGLPFCSVTVTALSRVGSAPQLLEHKP